MSGKRRKTVDANETHDVDVSARLHNWDATPIELKHKIVDGQGNERVVPLPEEQQISVGTIMLNMINKYKPETDKERFLLFQYGMAISKAMDNHELYRMSGPCLLLIQKAAESWEKSDGGADQTTLIYGQMAPLLKLVDVKEEE
jgi:hypothetical protein